MLTTHPNNFAFPSCHCYTTTALTTQLKNTHQGINNTCTSIDYQKKCWAMCCNMNHNAVLASHSRPMLPNKSSRISLQVTRGIVNVCVDFQASANNVRKKTWRMGDNSWETTNIDVSWEHFVREWIHGWLYSLGLSPRAFQQLLHVTFGSLQGETSENGGPAMTWSWSGQCTPYTLPTINSDESHGSSGVSLLSNVAAWHHYQGITQLAQIPND